MDAPHPNLTEVAKDRQLAAEKNQATAPTSGGRPLNLDANKQPGAYVGNPFGPGGSAK
jgi:hypothetical protein